MQKILTCASRVTLQDGGGCFVVEESGERAFTFIFTSMSSMFVLLSTERFIGKLLAGLLLTPALKI